MHFDHWHRGVFHVSNVVHQCIFDFSLPNRGRSVVLAADMEEPCYGGRHLHLVLLLGLSQLFAYVIGLPVLVLVFLHRNKNLDEEGLEKHATIVRYGLFYGAYKESTYYWEIVLTARKIMIVALSVFGPGLGTERQAQMVLAVLLVCISLEIAGDPFKLINDRFRILGRLEIATLFVQWATMVRYYTIGCCNCVWILTSSFICRCCLI